VRLESSPPPLEIYERPNAAPPITVDDLIDFHEALDRWPTALRRGPATD
jgi:hypothetical protein